MLCLIVLGVADFLRLLAARAPVLCAEKDYKRKKELYDQVAINRIPLFGVQLEQ
jgi:hypothetical protein